MITTCESLHRDAVGVAVCGAPATATVVTGCVHEHLTVGPMCAPCLDMTKRTAVRCASCAGLDVADTATPVSAGHEHLCTVALVSVTSLEVTP